MVEVLLTARQVQDRLAIDTSTIYRMAGAGRLPAVRIGRQWRFPAPAIDALLTAGEHAAPGAGPAGPPAQPAPPHVDHVGLPAATIEAALETLAPPLGVSLVVTDLAGTPLTSVVNPAPAIAARLEDPAFLAACASEWRVLAGGTDLTTRWLPGAFGFLCARSLVRRGDALVAMVLAGGVAPDDCDDPALFHLDAERREAVLEVLPRVASLLSRLGSAPAAPTTRE